MPYQFPTELVLQGRPGAAGLTVGYRLEGTAGGVAINQPWAAAFTEVAGQPGTYKANGGITIPDGFFGTIFYGINPTLGGPLVDVFPQGIGPGTYELASKLLAPGDESTPIDVNVNTIDGSRPAAIQLRVDSTATSIPSVVTDAIRSAAGDALTGDRLKAAMLAIQADPASPMNLLDLLCYVLATTSGNLTATNGAGTGSGDRVANSAGATPSPRVTATVQSGQRTAVQFLPIARS